MDRDEILKLIELIYSLIEFMDFTKIIIRIQFLDRILHAIVVVQNLNYYYMFLN